MLLMFPLFCLGAAGASFAVCLASRLLQGESICFPKRSYCPQCHHSLSWWQVVPVLGWVIQKGKCKYCYASISPWSTLYEIVCGGSLIILWNSSFFTWLAAFITFSTLTFLASTDRQQMVIYPVSLIGIVPIVQLIPWCFPHTLISLFICTTYSLLLLVLSWWHHAIGLGDCELLILILWLIGPIIGILIILASCLLMLPWQIFHRGHQPFVPSIAISLIIGCDLIAINPSLLAMVWTNPLIR